MADRIGKQFLVNHDDIQTTRVSSFTVPSGDALDSGQVVLSLNRFGFSSNNITYAATGRDFRYWDHFPASAGWGQVPVWGFGDVVESRHPEFTEGERVYGYFPMATHLVVQPAGVTPGGFLDGAQHRVELPAVYRQYSRAAKDPFYSEKTEELQMLLRPLFTTAFLLEDFFF